MSNFYKVCSEAIGEAFNGIASVAKNGVSIFEKITHRLGVEAPSSNSLFFIGSITKPMLAAIILKYVELGVLDLYAPISEADKFTLEDLLTHTSGLVPSRGREKATGYDFNYKKKGNFIYANQGYELAAKIVTQVSGKSIEALFQELFQQCDMKDSFIINNDDCDIDTLKKAHPRLIQGYMYVPTFHALIISSGICTDAWDIKSGYSQVKQLFKEGFQYLYPEAGNVVSTVHDLHKWNQSLGKLFKDKLIMQEYTKSRVFNIKFSGRTYDYCLGLHKGTQEPVEYGQSGWIYGYQSTSLFFPVQNISVVILENVSRIGGMKVPPLDFSAHDRIVAKVRAHINQI